MNISIKFILPAMLVLMFGCTSYQFISAPEPQQMSIPGGTEAFVENANLKDEFEILKKSGLYKLTADSLAPTKIRLKPLQTNLMCGNPLLCTIMTLGLLPSAVADQYRFSYVEKNDSTSTEHNVLIVVEMRFWLFEFLRGGSRNDALAEGLKFALNNR